MPLMSVQTENEILEAVEHLPDDAILIKPQVSWDDYERLLEALAERPHLRLSYDCGRLEIVTHGMSHGAYERLIEDLVRVACQVFRLKLEKFGSATWKRQSLSRGAEADASYYVENARLIIGQREINLESDPPPDIVVEIDITNDSLRKFTIYAALGVPEVWRYDGQTCRFYGLAGNTYTERRLSRFLPGLTGQMLADAVELSKTRGQDAALNAFRRKLRSSLKKKPR